MPSVLNQKNGSVGGSVCEDQEVSEAPDHIEQLRCWQRIQERISRAGNHIT